MTISKRSWLPLIALSLLVGACVTINIYFPAAAAETAADKIIDEVWQLQNGKNAVKKPEASSGASQP